MCWHVGLVRPVEVARIYRSRHVMSLFRFLEAKNLFDRVSDLSGKKRVIKSADLLVLSGCDNQH